MKGNLLNIQRAYDKSFKKWCSVVDNLGWRVLVEYCDSSDEMPSGSGLDAYAVCQAQYPYLSAVISVNLCRSKGLSVEEVDEIVCHELCHILLSPLDPLPSRELEYTVTSLSRILCGISRTG